MDTDREIREACEPHLQRLCGLLGVKSDPELIEAACNEIERLQAIANRPLNGDLNVLLNRCENEEPLSLAEQRELYQWFQERGGIIGDQDEKIKQLDINGKVTSGPRRLAALGEATGVSKMTKTLEASPELDAQVAVEVMEWKRIRWRLKPRASERVWRWANPKSGYYAAHADWSPSTDWAAAMEVLTKVMSEHPSTFAHVLTQQLAIGNVKILPHQISSMPWRIVGELLSKLTPLAICLAALEAAKQRATQQES